MKRNRSENRKKPYYMDTVAVAMLCWNFICINNWIYNIICNNNSCKSAEKEYYKRGQVQREFIEKFNERTGNAVQYIEEAYNPKVLYKDPRGWKGRRKAGLDVFLLSNATGYSGEAQDMEAMTILGAH